MDVEDRRKIYEAVDKLNALDGGDPEMEHGEAEEILLNLLNHFGANDASDAFKRAAERVDFWYA